MYHDFAGREIEDVEMDNMRRDAKESMTMADEVYTTTLEDVEKTAEEFGRIVVALPEHSQIIVLDDTMIGPGMIKQFDNTPYGYTLARRFAVRLCEEDETSEQSFEELRAEWKMTISEFGITEQALSAMHPEMDPIEKEIVLTILEGAMHLGYSVTVCDGAENVLENSTSKKEIFAAMFSTGTDSLFFDQNGEQVGWIFLVYGNRECIVSDYADNGAMSGLLKNADALIEKYS